MKNKLPKWLMAALGFASYTACSPVCMYGCPTVEMSVAARVQNEAGAPIGDIKVSLVKNQPEFERADTVAIGLTDAAGYCYLRYSTTGFGEPVTLTIGFDDIDGEARGGKHESTHIVHTFKDFQGSDGEWYFGLSSTFPEVTMKKVEE